jgi:hypothetical protein
MSDIRKTIKDFKPSLKESTLKQYQSQLNKLFKLLDTSDLSKLREVKFVLNKIKDLNYLTQRNYINSLIIYLRAKINLKDGDTKDAFMSSAPKYIRDYVDKRNSLNDQYTKQQSTGKISEKQAPNFVSVAEVRKMIKRMMDDYKKTDNIKTLMWATNYQILLKHPFRNDLAGMIVIGKREYNKLKKEGKLLKKNYLTIDGSGMFFVLRDYKTFDKYGEKMIPVDKSVKTAIRKYMKAADIKKGDVLFPVSKSSYSQLLIAESLKYAGKRIGTTMIRHIVLSDKHGEAKKVMDADSYQMGHSVATAQGIYVKDPADFKKID